MIFFKTLIVIFFFTELTLFFLVKFFKKDFKWIIEEEDYQPFFSNELIKKYNNEIFDKNLGWDNKKLKKEEYLISVQKKFIYNFDKSGSRLTKNKFKKNISAIFGDSYSLSRYANQNESIQFFLEKYNKSKILNYGAGNYGLDQVLIKIKTKKLKGIENVIIIVVPETIVRIQSYWKHFLEFGNILGFKPKFIFKNNKLILQRDHVKLLDKKKIKKKIDYIKSKDFFYKKKFIKYAFSFPYTFIFLKDLNINLNIFINLTFYKIFKKQYFFQKAYYQVLKRNIVESQRYYLNKDFINLLEKIIFEINNFLRKQKKNSYFFIVPQLLDIKFYNKINHSRKFYEKLSRKNFLNLFDLTRNMVSIKNIEKYYIEDFYGGHLNKKGNKLVSNLINKKLKKKI